MSMFKNYIESKRKYESRISQRPRPTEEDKASHKNQESKVQIIESKLISECVIDELMLIHSSPFVKLLAIELNEYGVIQVRYKFIDVVEGEKDYGRECIYPFGHLKDE
ncbi:hypothetical protein P3U41_05975 [Mammaliicoccus sciuri]|uniref:hypothetical protein n=1 Tax=Mammaliicoccus sciuri TaxID=1296 RepID=UPI002B2584CD|nr:hypothetical protein [Mammaliicoccus sciuri]WQL34318.1 hypothetical protein P3U41_05975 [Mammaliicoccus sciuri]WQL61257.1 hypothetical protein P3T96_05975 [Mammaliicoccus sciuri]